MRSSDGYFGIILHDGWISSVGRRLRLARLLPRLAFGVGAVSLSTEEIQEIQREVNRSWWGIFWKGFYTAGVFALVCYVIYEALQ